MKFTKLVPNIFYTDIKVGLKLFIDCLEFRMGHSEIDNPDNPFCMVKTDELGVLLFQNREFAEKDRPEIRLQTDNIEEVYAKISKTHPELLHPNLSRVTLRPWGAKEFALRDESDVCVIIQQW